MTATSTKQKWGRRFAILYVVLFGCWMVHKWTGFPNFNRPDAYEQIEQDLRVALDEFDQKYEEALATAKSLYPDARSQTIEVRDRLIMFEPELSERIISLGLSLRNVYAEEPNQPFLSYQIHGFQRARERRFLMHDVLEVLYGDGQNAEDAGDVDRAVLRAQQIGELLRVAYEDRDVAEHAGELDPSQLIGSLNRYLHWSINGITRMPDLTNTQRATLHDLLLLEQRVTQEAERWELEWSRGIHTSDASRFPSSLVRDADAIHDAFDRIDAVWFDPDARSLIEQEVRAIKAAAPYSKFDPSNLLLSHHVYHAHKQYREQLLMCLTGPTFTEFPDPRERRTPAGVCAK